MPVVRHTIPVTTNSSGAFEAATAPAFGRILQVRYVPDGTAPLDTDADLDITLKDSGVIVANHDSIGVSAYTRVYKQATHGADGAASLYASTGEPVEDYVVCAGESLKLAIANGGDTKAGTFYIWTG